LLEYLAIAGQEARLADQPALKPHRQREFWHDVERHVGVRIARHRFCDLHSGSRFHVGCREPLDNRSFTQP